MTLINQVSEPKDFSNLALAFSGGGYRAGAFHLGNLDFLQQVGLLQRVTMLSTVSGGTITGAKYVLALSQATRNNQSNFYEGFYSELYTFFLKTRLPDLWLQELRSSNPSDRPSLIKAAAEVYDKRLFGSGQFKDIMDVQSQLHLKEIIFNTTELRTGIDFRFRIGQGGQIGNGNVPIPQVLLKEVRIADVVAASSCFPGGFEPIAFPDDFQFNSSWVEIRKQVEAELEKNAAQIRPETLQSYCKTLKTISTEPLPLLDGGIYDNLGIGALLLANERLENNVSKEQDLEKKKALQAQRFETLLICDADNVGITAQPDAIDLREPLFRIPQLIVPNKATQLKLKGLVRLLQIVFVVALISTICFILLAFYAFTESNNLAVGLLASWASIVFAALTYLMRLLLDFVDRIKAIPKPSEPGSRKKKPELLEELQEIVSDWKGFLTTTGHLSISDVLNLFSVRLLSISSLFAAFLKGQRRQSYEFVSHSPEYRNKHIKSFIREVNEAYERQTSSTVTEQTSLPSDPILTKQMSDMSLKATQISTTLWLDEQPEVAQEQLNTLIACGQFTMCLNLIQYLDKVKIRYPEDSTQLEIIRERLYLAWEQFKLNPYVWVGDNRQLALNDWQKMHQSGNDRVL